MSAILESVLNSGLSAYAIIRDKFGNVWNGFSFETFNSSNWSSYALAMTEQTSTQYYKVAFPSSIPIGIYSFVVHVTTSTPTLGDQAVDRGSIDWDGSNQAALGSVTTKLPIGSISGFDPNSQNVNLNTNQSGVTIGTASNLGSGAIASVKAQVDASVGSDVIPELAGVPASTPTLKQALMFLFMAFRNRRTSTAATVGVYNAGGALISSATQTDNGTTYDKENFT